MPSRKRNIRAGDSDMTETDHAPTASSSRSHTPTSCSSPHASSSLNTTPARSPSPHARRRKIAIIGSGLTGLSAAYYLCTSPQADSLEVHLFERASKIGLDSNSISIGDAPPTRIDVPMRSLNEGYYPNVMRLYRTLGIPLKKSDFTYSFAAFKDGRRTPKTTLLYEGASGARGFGLPSACRGAQELPTAMEFVNSPIGATWTTVKNTSIWVDDLWRYLSGVAIFIIGYLHLLVVSLWYHYTGATRSSTHRISRHTLRTYYSRSPSQSSFLHDVVVPLFSAMMTVQASSVLDCPIADVFDYVAMTFARSHYTVAEGVQEVERRISEPLDERNVHVNCTVASLRRTAEGKVDVITTDGEFGGFDDVVLATQANQSAVFVQSYIDSTSGKGEGQLREMHDRLKTFKYEDSQVVNHTDRSILPEDERDWRDLNLVSPGGCTTGIAEKSHPSSKSTLSRNTHTMASHIILRNDSDADDDSPPLVIQTTNPLASFRPDPSTILSTSNFERAVLTLEGKEAQRGLFEWKQGHVELGHLQGQSGIWACGSWSPGIPLLEGCVVSARLVVDALLQDGQSVNK